MIISISLLSLPPSSSPLQHIRFPHYQLTHSSHSLKLSSISLQNATIVLNRRRALCRSNSNEPTKETPPRAAFLDEKGGVVEDMDGYLNTLSLEYESVWDTKPSWTIHDHKFVLFEIDSSEIKRCQPWTIALTGVLAIALSWLVLRSVVITTLVSALICAWWYIFLYTYPKAYSDMIAERRQNITDGVEDTFGSREPR